MNESGDSTTNSMDVKRIVREHYEQLLANKLDNLNKMEKFFERHQNYQSSLQRKEIT